jgi:hypothetical protein
LAVGENKGTKYLKQLYVEFDGRDPWVVMRVMGPFRDRLEFDFIIDDLGPAFVVKDVHGHAEGARIPPGKEFGEWLRVTASRCYFMARVEVEHNGILVARLENQVWLNGAASTRIMKWLRKPKHRSELIEP